VGNFRRTVETSADFRVRGFSGYWWPAVVDRTSVLRIAHICGKAVKPLDKGDHVLIEGELRSNEYDTEVPEVGKKDTTALVSRRTREIRARHVRKLDHKKQEKPKAA